MPLSSLSLPNFPPNPPKKKLTSSTYGPHTAGGEDLQFSSPPGNQLPLTVTVPYIEIARKVVIAIKHLKTPYYFQLGGTGSLLLPSSPFDTACDSIDFWTAYFYGCSDNEAYISYADERFPKFGMQLRRYQDVRRTSPEERDEEDEEFLAQMKTFAAGMVQGATFIRACRATLQFLEGNQELEWTFLSPPPGITPGPKTGKVEVGPDGVLPVEGAKEPPWEGRLRGITVKDMAAAIVDEVEGRKMVGRHWTVWTPREFVFNAPVKSCYGHLDELKGGT